MPRTSQPPAFLAAVPEERGSCFTDNDDAAILLSAIVTAATWKRLLEQL